MKICTYWTPGSLTEGCLAGQMAVVIDALRMTSTAITALAHGALGIRAVETVEEAQAVAASIGALLGGERQAEVLKGFDLSNSPLEYTLQRVRNRRIVMSTTNGTQAVQAAQGASHVVLGGFVNAAAVARCIGASSAVSIVCAGTNSMFTLEDAIAAGAIFDRIQSLGISAALDDASIAALRLYTDARDDLAAALENTVHYQRLLSLGMEEDIHFCLTEDRFDIVPAQGKDGWFA